MLRIIERAKTRLEDEEVQPSDALLNEIAETAIDRLNLRLGTDTLPKAFESIAVDISVKMFRRQSFEGISSEGGVISTAFVSDILREYASEIKEYKDLQLSDRKVRLI